MSKLISDLKKKITPKSEHPVGIKIPEATAQQSVQLKMKTQDKRGEHNINHNALLSDYKSKKGTKRIIPTASSKPDKRLAIIPNHTILSAIQETDENTDEAVGANLDVGDAILPSDIESIASIEHTNDMVVINPNNKSNNDTNNDNLLMSEPGVENLKKELETKRAILKGLEKMQADPDYEAESLKKELKAKRAILKGLEKMQAASDDDAGSGAGAEHTQVSIKPKKKRITVPIDKKLIAQAPTTSVKIGNTITLDRIPKPDDKVLIKASKYYMNNREKFTEFINNLFYPYREELVLSEKTQTCDNKEEDFSLMTHQKLVRDYINLYTPYRGLLLYHGLGSGKTCSSIAIAEGMKNASEVIIMTPASLRTNYKEELKKCGDLMYKKNQYWEFIDTKLNSEYAEQLSSLLAIPVHFIKSQGGAWMVNVSKSSNYNTLSSNEKSSLEQQLNIMLDNKYTFINYNGMNQNHLEKLTNNWTVNPFDNKVIIIDEAHNFVSRIVNKLQKETALSMRLYDYLMKASKCRIILLTGTPIINYPNEIGILFNILRGYIKTWQIPIKVKSGSDSQKHIEQILSKFNVFDYIHYKPSQGVLSITKNPYGFYSNHEKGTYEGVNLDERGDVSDEDFLLMVKQLLTKNGIEVADKLVKIDITKALPDSLNEFQINFIDSKKGDLKNTNLFKRRILGLTSYFRDIEHLMPEYNPERDYSVIEIDMSDYQFTKYEEARVQERKLEKQSAKKRKKTAGSNTPDDSASTYRIFSRAFCNFVFPASIPRPLPKDGEDIQTAALETIDENEIDAKTVDERIQDDVDGKLSVENIDSLRKSANDNIDQSYDMRIQRALQELKSKSDIYLTPEALETYSPKFLTMLENIQELTSQGLQLIYSSFRTLEGIAILKLIFEANGYVEFKLKKNHMGQWLIDIPADKMELPKFVLYTGTESQDEKELIRNIFNGAWDVIPTNLSAQLRTIADNNINGEIINIFMITASGAEGISLKNVRFVHIVEPYWHPVRIEQVVGRARRICSHEQLPPNKQNVKVFIYLMQFSKAQLKSDDTVELRIHDVSKLDKSVPYTSDQALYEIATIKQQINKQLLTAIKESAIDCTLYSSADSKEPLKCFGFGTVASNKFSYTPSLKKEEKDNSANRNKEVVEWEAQGFTLRGKQYALRKGTNKVYDFDTYVQAIRIPGIDPIRIGNLVKNKEGKQILERI